MGVKRGNFEKVGPSGVVAKPALATVKMSEFRPDIGVNLRTGAMALDAWSDAFGKMAETTSAIKSKQDRNASIVAQTEKDKDAACAQLKAYKDGVESGDIKANKDTEARLTAEAESMARRAKVAQDRNIWSNDFDYNRRY